MATITIHIDQRKVLDSMLIIFRIIDSTILGLTTPMDTNKGENLGVFSKTFNKFKARIEKRDFIEVGIGRQLICGIFSTLVVL